MKRPTLMVEQPVTLVHYGKQASWTDYGNGFGSDREVPYVEPRLMGKRPCRFVRKGDWYCVDLHYVNCPLCLKSAAAKAAKVSVPLKRNTMTAEGRLFWKSLDKSVRSYCKRTSANERFNNYIWMNRGERIQQVVRVEGRGNKVKLTLT